MWKPARAVGTGPGCPARTPTYDDDVELSVRSAPETTEDVVVVPEVGDGWVTVVWNDPVNLMAYVTYVFRTYFGYPQERAERLMLQVHEEGRATVSRGNREQMETDVQAMHGYGLWATLQQAE